MQLPGTEKLCVLAIDDEELNLGLIEEWLGKSRYVVLTAPNGERGLELLDANLGEVDIVLLDRMMPGMDGIEVLKRIKADERTRHIPVIMQTAAAASHQIIEGIEAGVHYYLTKPFDQHTLLSIVGSAAHIVQAFKQFNEELFNNISMLDCMESSSFVLQTLEQSRRLSIYLGKTCPNSKRGKGFTEHSFAFSEIITNAIEHGNYGITYDEKTELLKEGVDAWINEIAKRQLQYNDKRVRVSYVKTESEIVVRILDEGGGFDWERYMDIDPYRASDNHGRGIALSALIFDGLTYEQGGREAVCRIKI